MLQSHLWFATISGGVGLLALALLSRHEERRGYFALHKTVWVKHPYLMILISSIAMAGCTTFLLTGFHGENIVFVLLCAVAGNFAWIGAVVLFQGLRTSVGTLRIENQVLIVDGASSKRIQLSPGSIRAWTVGNGISGPHCLQLALGDSEASGLALYVFPKANQWALSDGASWLPNYTGLCPVARGPVLLSLLSPYIVPANQDWKRTP